jgi:hypothetical protein
MAFTHPTQFFTTFLNQRINCALHPLIIGVQIITLSLSGIKRVRTADPYNAIVVLYQLSYNPVSVPQLYLRKGLKCQSFLRIKTSVILIPYFDEDN